VNVKEFIYDLSYEIKAAFDKNYISKLIFDCEDLIISMELLVPLGLLINEILTNAYKHAICDNAPLNISISLASVPERKQRLSISDDGIGLPDGFNISQSEGLGLKLVKGLVSQIDGTLEIRSKPTTFSITFPEDVKHARRTKNNTDDYFT
jgi:two-component sensor histidine kinase